MILKEEYKTVDEALKEAKHWLLNIACHYQMVDNNQKAEGVSEAVEILDMFLSRVKF